MSFRNESLSVCKYVDCVSVVSEFISKFCIGDVEPSSDICGPFYYHGLILIPAWISNHIHYKVWDEITYPFLNFNGATVEV